MTPKKEQPQASGRYLWGNLLAMAVTAAALVAGVLVWLALYTRHGEEVAVPTLKGLPAVTAAARLEAAGLECVVGDSGYVPRRTAGEVLDQQPAPGARVKAGRRVTLTVNAAEPPTVVMPDLVDNSSMREARSRLEAMGFKLTPPEYVSGEREWVYGVKSDGAGVAAGARVRTTARLTLVVGDGLEGDGDSGEWDGAGDYEEEYGDVSYGDGEVAE